MYEPYPLFDYREAHADRVYEATWEKAREILKAEFCLSEPMVEKIADLIAQEAIG